MIDRVRVTEAFLQSDAGWQFFERECDRLRSFDRALMAAVQVATNLRRADRIQAIATEIHKHIEEA